jgi:hypothetical protein
VVRPADLYQPYDTREVVLDKSVSDLAEFSLDEGANYYILKTLNPWLRQSYLNNPKSKPYSLRLPA